MLDIKYSEILNDDTCCMIDTEFDKFAERNGVMCDYEPFAFIAYEGNKAVGVIKGHSYYNEVHISDLIVLEEYRGKHIGTRLIEAVEEHFCNKGFEIITLTTYSFQAPEFYKKCGFGVEFIRENRKNPNLTKYFLRKTF